MIFISILIFKIQCFESKEKELVPYWINTSDNQIVEKLLTSGGKELKEELEQLSAVNVDWEIGN